MTDVWVCCGVGGAGKTTTAAALAVGLALAGRRVVVLTIDPARRLADALGVAHLGNAPQPIALAAAGSLDALMLDRKATWDEVVRRQAPSEDVAERLLANPYYRALSTRLTGGHEYMATEKLYQLVHDGRWDTVVLDTPPSQHALDFFQAPDRIRRLLDQRLLGALLRPTEGILGVATRGAVGVIRRLAGDRVMADLEEFFDLVAGLSHGFRERGRVVHDLLHDAACRYVLVANARAPREDDTFAFLDGLHARGQRFAGFFLNRATLPVPVGRAALEAAVPGAPRGVDEATWATVTDALRGALGRRLAAAARDTATVARLRARGRAPVWPVPDVEGGVEDVDGLRALAAWLPPLRDPPA